MSFLFVLEGKKTYDFYNSELYVLFDLQSILVKPIADIIVSQQKFSSKQDVSRFQVSSNALVEYL